jgi:hypothetical protein
MKLRNAGRVIATATASVFAVAVMGGAFATSVDRFNYCMENKPDPDDIGARISCCKEAGGAWVEIYDADGNVVDAFCDGGEEVYEPEEVRTLPTVKPGLLDGAISGTFISVASDPARAPAAVSVSDPAPAAASVSDPAPAPASVSDNPTDSASLEPAASDPTPTPSPAPKKIKRKHRHRRHR